MAVPLSILALARKQIMELYNGNFYKVLLKLTESPYPEVQYNCAGVIGHLAINGEYERVCYWHPSSLFSGSFRLGMFL